MSTDEQRRRLISTRRAIPAERRAEYDAAWAQLSAAATAREAHAWRFVAAAAPNLFLEFLEFRADADPRLIPEVVRAVEALDDLADSSPGVQPLVEEWLELRG